MDQKCSTCIYYFNGNCRRYPPTSSLSRGYTNYENPIVEATSWCGEYKKREDTTLLREG